MSMFRKVETGIVVITEVEDSDEGDGFHTIHTTTNTNTNNTTEGEASQAGQLSEGKTNDEQALIAFQGGRSWKRVVLYNPLLRACYFMTLCVLLGLLIPYILTSFAFPAVISNARGSCFLNISYRFECLPGASPAPTQQECAAHGCCFASNIQDLYAPVCFHSIPSEYGYQVLNITTATGVLGSAGPLEEPGVKGRRTYRLGEAGDITLELAPYRTKTNFDTEAWSLRARVQRGGGDVVRVVVYSPEHDFFEDDFHAKAAASPQLEVTVTQDPDGEFNVTVTRLATGEEVVRTVFGPLIYGQHFAELTTRIPTQHLYGLGLRRNNELLPEFGQRARWPLFTEETTTMVANTSVATGRSGAHPFFMNFEKTPGYMYGLYLKTSAPVEVGMTPVPAVVFRGVGSLWDLRIMAGPTPRDVTRQYTQMVGRPAMPPYWALGYHLCRAAAHNLSAYDNVVKAMEAAQIPYESDCIDARLSHPASFAPLPAEALTRVAALKEQGRKFMLVQSPFVTYGSDAFNDSAEFLLKYNDSTNYYGSVEGVAVGYPDYANENTLPLWLNRSAGVRSLYGSADGVMLLHNTPLNQAMLNYTLWNGSIGCTPETPDACCPDPALPFLPRGVADINNHSLCVSLLHASLRNAPHLHYHNAYGYYHHRRIHALMKEISPRTRHFVTSQSSHPGSGAEGAVFGESFGANFMEQKEALVQVLEMGLYGVPLAGVPICGSRNDSNGEMRSEWCLRGHQMAAFWPLMVSHYEHNHQARNPTDFDKAFTYQLGVFIKLRYSLLPYFYTLLYEASVEGTPMVRPLFYEFPEDEGCRRVSTQFMAGGGLMVSPALQSVGDMDSIDALLYFPPGRWYNFFSGVVVVDNPVNGTHLLIPTLMADLNVHVRGGAIVPLQGNLHDWVKTTEASRKVNFTLIAALCCNDSASSTFNETGVMAEGSLYLDDGVTVTPHDLAAPTAEHLHMTAAQDRVTVTRVTPPSGGSGLCALGPYSTLVDVVRVYGVPYLVAKVTVNGARVTTFEQNADTGTLTISGVAYDWCVSPSLLVTWRA